ncbi:hypothetical protein CTAYLR_004281 [Chrysophaeum taylorii]|uniref:Dynein heavy chain linker domain-containing protein n=1 Tax=Chrysophaeum taylorii TaxID=2483200 RepID=A0AAD7XKU7_9STRA|nr:hypothetical protein CTAYLR_004281 [Chrysophaeum taylorii]
MEYPCVRPPESWGRVRRRRKAQGPKARFLTKTEELWDVKGLKSSAPKLKFLVPPKQEEDEESRTGAATERPPRRRSIKTETTTTTTSKYVGDDEAIEKFNLKTSEDAIHFFSQSKQGLKFVYLISPVKLPAELGTMPPRDSRLFRPYDLVVLPPSAGDTLARLAKEYYTMSAEGLVRMGSKPSEFIPLTRWMREAACFNMLSSIPFFRDFLRNKCFKTWRLNASFLMFRRQRQRLAERLFLGMPSFAPALIALKEKMYYACPVLVDHKLDVQQHHHQQQQQQQQQQQPKDTNSSFESRQQKAREAASKQLNDTMDEAAKAIHAVCETVIAAAARSPTRRLDGDTFVVLEEEEPKSISALRELQAKRKAAHRRALLERRLLPEFVRLADYVGVESLVTLLIRSWRSFLVELTKPKTGLLESQVRFTESGSTFHPTCNYVQTLLSNTADEVVSALGRVLRILYRKPPSGAVERAIDVSSSSSSSSSDVNATNSVVEMIHQSSEYQSIRASINAKVASDFERARGYVDAAFERIQPIYEYTRNWDFQAFKSRAQTVVSLKHELEKVSSWQKDLDKMRTRQTIGLIEVESRKLKEILIPLTKERMEQLKDYALQLSRAKCRDQRAKFEAGLGKIEERPTELEPFASLLERLDYQRDQSRSLAKQTHAAEQLYHLVNDFEVRGITEDDGTRMDNLRSLQNEYLEEIEAASAYCAAKRPSMLEVLDARAAQLKEKIEALDRDLREEEETLASASSSSSDSSDSSSTVSDLLRKLLEARDGVVKPRLDEIAKADADLRHKHDLFRHPQPRDQQFAFKILSDKVESIETLRQIVEGWDHDYNAWMHDDIRGLDTATLRERANLYKVAAVDELSPTTTSKIVVTLERSIEGFCDKLDLLSALGSPCVKKKHWEQIFARLECQCPPDSEKFTLDSLSRAGLEAHAPYVKDVVLTAQSEAIQLDVHKAVENLVTRVVASSSSSSDSS